MGPGKNVDSQRKKLSTAYLEPRYSDQVRGRRDALSQHLYSRVWRWVVELINRRLEQFFTAKPKRLPKTGAARGQLHVLDIFGFEDFGGFNNSLEQLCINYTNELLSELYLTSVFDEAMTKYKAVGLDGVPAIAALGEKKPDRSQSPNLRTAPPPATASSS